MFDDIISSEKIKKILVNELKQNKKSRTYLLNGGQGIDTMEKALAMSKAFLCNEMKEDFCDKCVDCKRVESRNYPDLFVYGENSVIKIADVREIIYEASSSSIENKKKIFILDNIHSMRTEAINALLKVIEEPLDNIYFILLTKSLNILPTIISRSFVINLEKKTADELGVTKEEYDFFQGNVVDINKYKLQKESDASSVDLNLPESYENIGSYISEYKKEFDITEKIKIYKALRDFVSNKNYMKQIDKIYFAGEFSQNLISTKDVDKDKFSPREFLKELLNYTLNILHDYSKIEDLVKLKRYNTYNVNISLLAEMFFLEV